MKLGKSKGEAFNIVSEGLLANQYFAEGRLIAGVVLESDEDCYLKEIIKQHTYDNLKGDVEIVWAKIPVLGSVKQFILSISFKKPIVYQFYIKFPIPKYLLTIDAILQSRGVRISLGTEGDKVSNTPEHMVIEIPKTDFDSKWNNILLENMKKEYKKGGWPKSEINEKAKNRIKTFREILNYRIK